MIRLATVVLVVRNLERALAVYEQGLGFERTGEAEDVPSVGARHVVLRAENCQLELLEPHDDSKPPGLFLRARGEGVFAVELQAADPQEVRDRMARMFVQARGGAHWYVPPTDAHGLLVEVGPREPERSG
jgi:catechol 2,3-dioxygenase-like lactoylglutathione lyase family enzyme